MKTEKKEYISPVSEILEIGTLNVLALSVVKDEKEQMDSEYSLSQEYRGDWENIWEGM